jgi:hypothetical protein
VDSLSLPTTTSGVSEGSFSLVSDALSIGAVEASAPMVRGGRAPMTPTVAPFFYKSCRKTIINQTKKIQSKAKRKSKRAEENTTSARRFTAIVRGTSMLKLIQNDFIKFQSDLHRLREVIPSSERPSSFSSCKPSV